MSKKHPLIPVMAVAVALLVLAGCGSGNGDGGDEPITGGGATVGPGSDPAALADPFVTQVQSVIADTSDTSEPRDIGNYQVTIPETNGPVPLS